MNPKYLYYQKEKTEIPSCLRTFKLRNPNYREAYSVLCNVTHTPLKNKKKFLQEFGLGQRNSSLQVVAKLMYKCVQKQYC